MSDYEGRHRATAPTQDAAAHTHDLLTDRAVSREVKVRALALYLGISTDDADQLMQEVGE